MKVRIEFFHSKMDKFKIVERTEIKEDSTLTGTFPIDSILNGGNNRSLSEIHQLVESVMRRKKALRVFMEEIEDHEGSFENILVRVVKVSE